MPIASHLLIEDVSYGCKVIVQESQLSMVHGSGLPKPHRVSHTAPTHQIEINEPRQKSVSDEKMMIGIVQ